jgi:chromosome segregation ATPase
MFLSALPAHSHAELERCNALLECKVVFLSAENRALEAQLGVMQSTPVGKLREELETAHRHLGDSCDVTIPFRVHEYEELLDSNERRLNELLDKYVYERDRAGDLSMRLEQQGAYALSLKTDLGAANRDLEAANRDLEAANRDLEAANRDLETANHRVQTLERQLGFSEEEIRVLTSKIDGTSQRENDMQLRAVLALRRARFAEDALEEAETKLRVAADIEDVLTQSYEQENERADESERRAEGLERELAKVRRELAEVRGERDLYHVALMRRGLHFQ